MNNKNKLFNLMQRAFTPSSLLPMQQLSPQEKKDRIKYILYLRSMGALHSHYAQNPIVQDSLIDSDIALLEENSEEALSHIKHTKGPVCSCVVPGFLNMCNIPAKFAAFLAIIFAGVGSVLVYKVWYSSLAVNFIGDAGETTLDFVGVGLINQIKAGIKFAELKYKYLVSISDYNRKILSFVLPAIPVALVGAAILTRIARYACHRLAQYNIDNALYINNMEKQYNQNHAVIAELKRIKLESFSCK